VAVGAVALWACAMETADDSNKIVANVRIENRRVESIIALSSDTSFDFCWINSAAISWSSSSAALQKQHQSMLTIIFLKRGGFSLQECSASAACSRGTTRLTA